MKRTMTAVCTTLVTGMITPAFAANTSTGHTDISLFVPNDPIYTVTVPEKVTLSATEHTQVPVTASDVQYIPEGKKISVILKKGNGVYGRLYLTGDKNNGNKPYLMTIMIKGTGDEFKMLLKNRLRVWNSHHLLITVLSIMKCIQYHRIILKNKVK